MITTLGGAPSTRGKIFKTEEDSYDGIGSSGALGMKRSKRNGRVPSTCARNSRKYGLSMIYSTGIPPLNNVVGLLII